MIKARVEEIEAEKEAEKANWKSQKLGSGGAMKANSF